MAVHKVNFVYFGIILCTGLIVLYPIHPPGSYRSVFIQYSRYRKCLYNLLDDQILNSVHLICKWFFNYSVLE